MSFKRRHRRARATYRCCECESTLKAPLTFGRESTVAALAEHGWVLSLTDPKREVMQPLCQRCAKAVYGDAYDEALRLIRDKAPKS